MTGAALAVTSPVHVTQARQLAARAARQAELPDTVVERVALATVELATNLVKYATDGMIVVMPGPERLDVIATDRGPGIEHVPESMRDGFSTTGTLGIGLGGIRRMADEFDIYSSYGEGTTVLARWRSAAREEAPDAEFGVAVGAALSPAPGETSCGDSWTSARCDEVLTVALSDGLGHGPEAAAASLAAMEQIAAAPAASPVELISAMDADMRPRRGATVAVVQFHVAKATVTFCGVGNTTVRLVRGDGSHEALVSTPGIVGRRQRSGRRAMPVTRPWEAQSLLVMHTDGVSERWTPADRRDALDHDPATVAGWLLGTYGRNRDDACVVVVAGRGTR
ncbi:ATP-binding protein [Saccharomonospora azurea]|uniref:Anti-sigma regulatory factor (Ser/Thr protein kinase) n=1 Tax=Saccharomonospora azurea NA-128 TaxID=882081 RepID=H8GDS5_9PSEU|nr:ATP-binding protein [Saccharomonospora azurea]EHY88869.1 anti-sigma regulatory factor (Ser/Thr protein kinase) [Saccharomonospora azurea NA-128]